MHFICAEESDKRELKGHNIIGYVPDFSFKVLLRKLLYGNLKFLYQNWNYLKSMGVNTGVYLVNYNHNG